MNKYPSWGNYPIESSSEQHLLASGTKKLPEVKKMKILTRGLGRSYGDSCLNNGNALLLNSAMNKILNFDENTGIIDCEPGVSLAQILEFAVPLGWFLAVTPGTKFVSIGGAVANDVHGKNHHIQGSFGCHLQSLQLLRSDGEIKICSLTENEGLFRATIGGLGLTGLILQASFLLKKIVSPLIEMHSRRFANLDEFFALSEQNSEQEYSVAWMDSLAVGKNLGRGIFMHGVHSEAAEKLQPHTKPKLSIPCKLPSFTLNEYSIRSFNWLYFNKHSKSENFSHCHYDSFFYPLDKLANWNRIYGKKGFVQYQFVVPVKHGKAMLERISRSGFNSFLTVMKVFGDKKSPGMMSFPQPGLTVALDFSLRQKNLFSFLDQLDRMVMEFAGKVYIAKDARMSAAAFFAFYPQAEQFSTYIDPAFSSSFWRRVNPVERSV